LGAVLEPRVYRAAFVPALLALVLAAFSLESRPRALPQGLAADIPLEDATEATLRLLVESQPDRRPGKTGNLATAAQVRDELRSRGFQPVTADHFSQGSTDLVNVVGRRDGRSRQQVVVVAARDASSVPDAPGSAADTAALLEMARVFEGRPSRKTLVLASIDGSTMGELGAERLADELGDPELVDAVIVISNLGERGEGESPIVPWSNDSKRAPIGLERTVAASLREELDLRADSTGAAGQLARLSFPIGIGAQGVLLERGFDALRISGSGELAGDGGELDEVDEERLGALVRTTLRTVTAVDQGPRPDHGPKSYVTAVSQVMPGWVLAAFSLALILPALVGSIDAFARARRRREPVARWLRWLVAQVAPFVAALVLAELLSVARATPDPPPAPVPPDLHPLDVPALLVLAAVAGAAALLWAAARFMVVRTDSALADSGAPGAACATCLVLGVTVLLLWLVNPYAALVLVPALHLWLLATLVDPPPARRVRVALVAAGLLVPLLVALYYMLDLSLDPLSGVWYLLLLIVGGHVGVATAVIACVLLGMLTAVAGIARRPSDEPELEPRPSVRGPASYAGPGSLGGTESALRR
jgi:hypothetical protein